MRSNLNSYGQAQLVVTPVSVIEALIHVIETGLWARKKALAPDRCAEEGGLDGNWSGFSLKSYGFGMRHRELARPDPLTRSITRKWSEIPVLWKIDEFAKERGPSTQLF